MCLRSNVPVQRSPVVLLLLVFLLLAHPSVAQEGGQVWFAQAGANGDGTTSTTPVGSTRALEALSGPGDVLVLLPSGLPLADGIALQAGQTLIGVTRGGRKPVLTNVDSTANEGVGIMLAAGSRVVGVRVDDTYASGILGINADSVQISGVEVSGSNRSGSYTTATVNALGAPFPHGGIVFLALGPEGKSRNTVSQSVIRGASGIGVGTFAAGGAQSHLVVSQTHVEGGAVVPPYDVGVGAVAEGPGGKATLLLADSEVRDRVSPAARNVIAFASAGASSSARVERSLVTRSGQDGVIGVAALVPADVGVEVIDSVVEGSAQTNVEGTILNMPPYDAARAGESRVTVAVRNSTLGGAGDVGPDPFEGRRANVYLGSSAIAQQMDPASTVPFPPGSYTLDIHDSRLSGTTDYGVSVGGSGAQWGIGPEQAEFDAVFRDNEIGSSGSAVIALYAPQARVDARRNCWSTLGELEERAVAVEPPAVRSQIDATEPVPCEAGK